MKHAQTIAVGFVALRQNPSPSEASGDGAFAFTELSSRQVPAAQAEFVAARQIPPVTTQINFTA